MVVLCWIIHFCTFINKGVQWLSGRVWERSGSVVECLTRDRGAAGSSFTVLCPWARHINPSLVLVQPRKTRPYITERLLMGCKESNQAKTFIDFSLWCFPFCSRVFIFFVHTCTSVFYIFIESCSEISSFSCAKDRDFRCIYQFEINLSHISHTNPWER